MITTKYIVCKNIIFKLRGQNIMLAFNHKENIIYQCVGWLFFKLSFGFEQKSLIGIGFQQGNDYIYKFIYVLRYWWN